MAPEVSRARSPASGPAWTQTPPPPLTATSGPKASVLLWAESPSRPAGLQFPGHLHPSMPPLVTSWGQGEHSLGGGLWSPGCGWRPSLTARTAHGWPDGACGGAPLCGPPPRLLHPNPPGASGSQHIVMAATTQCPFMRTTGPPEVTFWAPALAEALPQPLPCQPVVGPGSFLGTDCPEHSGQRTTAHGSSDHSSPRWPPPRPPGPAPGGSSARPAGTGK